MPTPTVSRPSTPFDPPLGLEFIPMTRAPMPPATIKVGGSTYRFTVSLRSSDDEQDITHSNDWRQTAEKVIDLLLDNSGGSKFNSGELVFKGDFDALKPETISIASGTVNGRAISFSGSQREKINAAINSVSEDFASLYPADDDRHYSPSVWPAVPAAPPSNKAFKTFDVGPREQSAEISVAYQILARNADGCTEKLDLREILGFAAKLRESVSMLMLESTLLLEDDTLNRDEEFIFNLIYSISTIPTDRKPEKVNKILATPTFINDEHLDEKEYCTLAHFYGNYIIKDEKPPLDSTFFYLLPKLELPRSLVSEKFPNRFRVAIVELNDKGNYVITECFPGNQKIEKDWLFIYYNNEENTYQAIDAEYEQLTAAISANNKSEI